MATSLLSLAPSNVAGPSPLQLKQLVHDYLASSCYLDSATAFARESTEYAASPSSNGHRTAKGKAPLRPHAPSDLARPRTRSAQAAPFDADGDHTMLGAPPALMDDDDEDDGREAETLEHWLVNGERHRDHPGGEDDLSGLAKADADDIVARRDIREHILAGRIHAAMEHIKRQYPAVLSVPPSTPSARPPARSYSAETFFVPAVPVRPTTPGASTSSPAVSEGASSLVLRPVMILLNLQVQGFIELIRTASTMSLSTPPSPRPHSPTLYSSTHSQLQTVLDEEDLDGHDSPMSASTSSLASVSSVRTSMINTAISRAQIIFNQVQTLREEEAISLEEKTSFEKELQSIAGLMAYKDLSAVPEGAVRKVLDLSRRRALADLVNAAILILSGKTATSILALAVRQTTAIWGALGEWKVTLPHPPTAGGSTNGGTVKKDRTNKNLLPKFDLRTFLDESEETVVKGVL